MKKILLGALVTAAVAGVVYYLYEPEKFNDTLGDLRDKADDILGKARNHADDLISRARSTAGTTSDNMSGLAV